MRVLLIEVLKGVAIYGCLSVLIVIYTVYAFGPDSGLGKFNASFAALTILTSYIFGKYIKAAHYSRLSLINTGLILLTLSLFISEDTRLNFILYNICYSTFVVLVQLITDVNMFNISNCDKISDRYRIEFFAVRELALSIGRLTGYSLLFLAGSYSPETSLKVLLIFLTFVVLFTAYLSNRLQNLTQEECGGDISSYAKAA
jgi:hypothetical protein